MKRRKRPANGTVTPISDKLIEVRLTDDEKTQINALEANLGQTKMALAEVQLQIMALETQRLQFAQKVMEANQAVFDRVKGAAQAHGIDTEDPSKGRWNLDTASGVFTRVA